MPGYLENITTTLQQIVPTYIVDIIKENNKECKYVYETLIKNYQMKLRRKQTGQHN